MARSKPLPQQKVPWWQEHSAARPICLGIHVAKDILCDMPSYGNYEELSTPDHNLASPCQCPYTSKKSLKTFRTLHTRKKIATNFLAAFALPFRGTRGSVRDPSLDICGFNIPYSFEFRFEASIATPIAIPIAIPTATLSSAAPSAAPIATPSAMPEPFGVRLIDRV